MSIWGGRECILDDRDEPLILGLGDVDLCGRVLLSWVGRYTILVVETGHVEADRVRRPGWEVR